MKPRATGISGTEHPPHPHPAPGSRLDVAGVHRGAPRRTAGGGGRGRGRPAPRGPAGGRPPCRRRGYALEAAQGLMDWAAREHGVRLFRLSIAPDNAPSLAMAAKMGFRQVGEQMDDEDGLELVFDLAHE